MKVLLCLMVTLLLVFGNLGCVTSIRSEPKDTIILQTPWGSRPMPNPKNGMEVEQSAFTNGAVHSVTDESVWFSGKNTQIRIFSQ